MLFDRLSIAEFFAFWRDGVTAGELGRLFGLTREQTQKAIIRPFHRQYGAHLRYDKRVRRVVLAADAGALKISPSHVADAMNFLSAGQAFARAAGLENPPLSGWVPMEDLLQPVENEREANNFRALYAAAARRSAVHLSYAAKSGRQEIMFSPHALVRTTSRPHFRGYASYGPGSVGQYIDVIPGRVVDTQPGLTKDYVGAHDDVDWYRRVAVEATLNPDLPDEVAASLRQEYAFADRLRIQRLRAATAPYVCEWLKRRRLYGLGVTLWGRADIIA
jgi:hypothetical protein